MRTITPLVIFIMTAIPAFPQNVGYSVPPSPNALAGIKFVNVPVSHQTGTPSVNLPITELVGKELKVPVSLNYHASGVKISDIASYVGLGWHLSAGGAISRVVRGLPDEEMNGYCGSQNRGEMAATPNDETYVEKVMNNEWDAEPDIFYLMLPNRSIRFVLDASGNPVIIPYQDIVIQPAVCNGAQSFWEVIDENGIHYQFGGNSHSRETTSSRTASNGTIKEYISTWHLSKITSANGSDIINFNYQAGSDYSYTMTYRSRIDLVYDDGISCGNDITAPETFNNDHIITIKSPKYLQEISSSLGKLRFSVSEDRIDLPNSGRYDQIELLDHTNERINQFHLVYRYFSSSQCYPDKYTLCKRLRLDRVVEAVTNQQLHRFVYNTSTNLEWRNSNNTDYWGFYNGNTVDTYIPAFTDQYGNYTGADKSPDLTRTKANILTRIYNHLGGYKELTYQGNSYQKDGVNTATGGLRISKIETFDGRGGRYATQYLYEDPGQPGRSSGQIYNNPIYHEYLDLEYSFGHTILRKKFLKRFSNPISQVTDLNGYHVAYSAVQEIFPDGSKKVYYFNNFNDHPDLRPKAYLYSPRGTGHLRETLRGDNPYTPKTYQGWKRNLPLLIEHIDADEYLRSSTRYVYNFNLGVKKDTVLGLTISQRAIKCNTWPPRYIIDRYKYIASYITLDSLVETVYPSSVNPALSQTSIKTFDYTRDILLKSSTSVLPGSKTYITTHKYPFEYSYSGALDVTARGLKSLKDHHVLIPVETTTSKDMGPGGFQVLNSQLTLYSNNNFRPSHMFKLALSEPGNMQASTISSGTFSKDNRYRLIGRLNYNTNSRLIEQTGIDDLTTTMEWDASNRYNTATVVGGQRTEYVHEPLLGVRSVKDPNGLMTYYTYSPQNWLSTIKNDDNKILEKNEYSQADHAFFLKVSMPSASSSWKQGTTRTISWNNYMNNVNIRLIKDGVTISTIVTNRGGTSYSWAIPFDIIAGDYQIKVQDAQNPDYYQLSGIFRIENGEYVRFTKPIEHEIISQSNATYLIKWEKDGGLVRIELYSESDIDSGAGPSEIIADNYSGTQVVWYLNRPYNGIDYYLKILKVSNPSVHQQIHIEID